MSESQGRSLSHFMDVDTVVSALLARHGAAKALRHVMREQQGARRARSRKRFTFWSVVATALSGEDSASSTGVDVSAVNAVIEFEGACYRDGPC